MRTLQSIGFVLLGGLSLSLGCQIIAGVESDAKYDPTLSPSSSGSGGTGGGVSVSAANTSSSSSGMGGMGGTGGSGGEGGTPECLQTSDCVSMECRKAVDCVAGSCIWQNAADGETNISQIYGDCKDRVCDGNGNTKTVDGDPSKDIYDWKNPCYINGCVADPVMEKMPNDNAACTKPWDMMPGYCMNFKCVECKDATECMPVESCAQGRCIPLSCTDMMATSGETDVDCGGPDCLPCLATANCAQDSDCESGLCDTMTTGRCLAPSCNDGLRNGDETDLDCGGSCSVATPPAPCATTKKCLFPADCESGVCRNGTCAFPTCLDYTKNQDEEGIDCGGSCPLKCPGKP